jgi:hypothetical protein
MGLSSDRLIFSLARLSHPEGRTRNSECVMICPPDGLYANSLRLRASKP